MTITFVLRQSVISTFCVEASCKILSAVEIQCYSIVKQSLTTQSVLGHHVQCVSKKDTLNEFFLL